MYLSLIYCSLQTIEVPYNEATGYLNLKNKVSVHQSSIEIHIHLQYIHVYRIARNFGESKIWQIATFW